MDSWAQNDTLFINELKAGYQWQYIPAIFFKLNGLSVEIPELTIRDNISEADKWLESKDLIVNGYTIECKSRNEEFTNKTDYPYGTCFVDTVSGYDAKTIKPIAYIIISRKTGSMLCIQSSDNSSWGIEEKFDHVRKIREKFYTCGSNRLHPLSKLTNYIKAIGVKPEPCISSTR